MNLPNFTGISSAARRAASRVVTSASARPTGNASSSSPTGSSSLGQRLAAGLAAGVLIASSLVLPAPVQAASKEKVGEFAASGLIFKDTVEVTALDDPDVEGITLYISDFKRSLADKLAKDFFSEPSQTSVTAVVTGPVKIKDIRRLGGAEGTEIFSEGKGLNLFKNKTVRVRRLYDDDRRTLVYVTYSTRLTGASDDGGPTSGRYRTSVTAIRLPDSVFDAPASASQN